jgi:hypothetical protein
VRARNTFSRLLAPVLTGAVLLSGCTGEVGAAAVVGSVAIPTSTLERSLAALPSVPTNTLGTDRYGTGVRTLTSRILLTDAVIHQILVQRGLNLSLTPEQVEDALAQYPSATPLQESLQAPPDLLAERVADSVALLQLVGEAIQNGKSLQAPVVDIDFVSFSDSAAADEAYRRYVADPAALKADATANSSGQSGSTELSFVTASALAPYGLFSVKPGTILQVPHEAGVDVVRVSAHRMEARPLDVEALNQISPRAINQIGAALLAQDSAAAEMQPSVEVNPRFGRWDEELFSIVAAS